MALFQHSYYEASVCEYHKGDNKYIHQLENLKMAFYFLHCHGKFVTIAAMLTYLMLSIGLLPRYIFCHNDSFNIING